MQQEEKKTYKPVVLVILDGLGVNVEAPYSTWKNAKMPTLRSLEEYFPFTTIQASGIAVGLPWGQEGNSEVGHLTIGAGRALYHHLPRIISAIEDGSFFRNEAFVETKNHIKQTSGTLHLMGLFSSGSVHAYADHLYALLDFAKQENISRVYLHLFTDGKDSPAKEGKIFFTQLMERLSIKYPFAKIASVMGRFYAMDRDDNWDRIEKAYRCLVDGIGNLFANPVAYLVESYNRALDDTVVEPGSLGVQEGRIHNGDAVIFYNYREDSERELAAAFTLETFNEFSRKKIENLFFVTMTEYEKNIPAHIAFPPLDIRWPLARVIAEAGKRQLHIAETEKYAHVTYFFNGGTERSFPQEDRILVQSPHTAHIDEVPEMASIEITKRVLENISSYDFILVNFANADMVGHTGNFEATVRALEALDRAIGEIISKTLEQGGVIVITADHGNAEEKIYASSGEKRTKHTANPVPLFIVGENMRKKEPFSAEEISRAYRTTEGVITDIAPTILTLLGIPKPIEMTGIDLLPKLIN